MHSSGRTNGACRPATRPLRVALYLERLEGGGAERVMLNLAEGLAGMGYKVDLVVNRFRGAYSNAVPTGVRVIELKFSTSRRWRRLHECWVWARAFPSEMSVILCHDWLAAKICLKVNGFKCLPALIKYLRREQPSILISALPVPNLTAIWARQRAKTSTQLIATTHCVFSAEINGDRKAPLWQGLARLAARFYPYADALTAVSNGTADDLAATTGLPRARIHTLYNPIVTPRLKEQSEASPHHPWLAPGELPVVLSAGRFAEPKGFATLLRAFAQVRRAQPARMIILGEGPDHDRLQALARALGIQGEVDMPGWVDNPYAYMARAGVFVLASRFEALPTVLVEALACGCPVIATDCPRGPREILADGRHGRLVPVDDVAWLTKAIVAALDETPDRTALRARGNDFSAQRALNAYQQLIQDLASPTTDRFYISEPKSIGPKNVF